VHHRPLALVSALAGGDYLLWNWSLQGNHDALALVAGLTLPPLAIALIWLLALNAARLLARLVRPQQPQQRGMQMRQPLTQHEQHPGGEQASSSSKLAA
jgi:hypothetical protein